jgi:hypothetical protein
LFAIAEGLKNGVSKTASNVIGPLIIILFWLGFFQRSCAFTNELPASKEALAPHF